MARATLPALLLTTLLLASVATVQAERDDAPADAGGPGRGGDRGGRSGPDAPMREAQDERHDFQERFHEAREACHALNGTGRAACIDNLTATLQDFNQRQREAFHAKLAELRDRPRPEALGGFVLQRGDFAGAFVSFTWDGPNATLRDYTVAGCLVFERVARAGAGANASVRVEEHGRVLRIAAGDGRLLVHDNPRGVLVARAPTGGAVDLALAPDVAGARTGDHVNLTGCADWRGLLAGHTLSLAGRVASADREATFMAREANPAAPAASRSDDDAVEDAVAHRDIGAEITVVGDDDATGIATTLLDDAVTAQAHHGDDRVRVVVNGTASAGKTFILNIAPGLLQGDRVAVRYYDEASGNFTQVPITPADSFADVLDPTDDAGPEYFVRHTDDGTVVYVSVDHFSTHAFEVFGVLDQVSPSVLAGAVGGVALVAVAAAGLARRRRA